jgi:predicted MFS family arabinose efflux permease
MSTAALVAAFIMTVVGASTFNILPLLTAGAANTLGFSDREVGVMSVAITTGASVAAVLAGAWVRAVPWSRAAAVGLAGMVAANSLAMVVHFYWIFIVVQGAAGFFGSSVFCLAMTVLSDRSESARTFGIVNAMQVAYQILALSAGPTLLRVAGLNGILGMLAALSALTIAVAPLLPARGRIATSDPVQAALFKPATLLGLVGFFAFFVNVGGYWTYIELMGQAQGLTSRTIANCMVIGISAGIVGGIAAWMLGDRFGRLWPMYVAAVLTVEAALLLKGAFGATSFIVSGLLYYSAWNYSYAYQLAIVNAVDTTGRAVAVTQAFGFLGIAAGAGLAAFFVTPGDYHAVIWLVAVFVCLSAGLLTAAVAVHRYRTAPLNL